MTIGTVLLLDGLRRFAIDAYKGIRPNIKIRACSRVVLGDCEKAQRKTANLERSCVESRMMYRAWNSSSRARTAGRSSR